MKKSSQVYELAPFNLDRSINLGEVGGYAFLKKTQDEKITLTIYDSENVKTLSKTRTNNFCQVDALLAYCLDIGIQKRRLLVSDGYYMGGKERPSQSSKTVSSNDFDQALFKKAYEAINTAYKTQRRWKEAVRLNYLLEVYNAARLLYPEHIQESYLNLMRIIDSEANSLHENKAKALEFALTAVKRSSDTGEVVLKSIGSSHGLYPRIKMLGRKIGLVRKYEKNIKKTDFELLIKELKEPGDKFVFFCFYSAYKYRNKFAHNSFPFPDVLVGFGGSDPLDPLSYLHSSLATHHLRRLREDGLKNGDTIDIHTVLSPFERKRYKDHYYLYLPTWFFMKTVARNVITARMNDLIKIT